MRRGKLKRKAPRLFKAPHHLETACVVEEVVVRVVIGGAVVVIESLRRAEIGDDHRMRCFTIRMRVARLPAARKDARLERHTVPRI